MVILVELSPHFKQQVIENRPLVVEFIDTSGTPGFAEISQVKDLSGWSIVTVTMPHPGQVDPTSIEAPYL